MLNVFFYNNYNLEKKIFYHKKCVILAITGVEEVSMKWMDRPSVTEIDRGGVYDMDR